MQAEERLDKLEGELLHLKEDMKHVAEAYKDSKKENEELRRILRQLYKQLWQKSKALKQK